MTNTNMSKLIVAALALSQALVASNAAATKCYTFSGVSKDKAPTAVSKACGAGKDSCVSNYHPVTKLYTFQCTTAATCTSGQIADGTTQVCCATDDCNTVAKAVPVYCNMYGGPTPTTAPIKVDKDAEYCGTANKGMTNEACKMGCPAGTKHCVNSHMPTGKKTWDGGCVVGNACTSALTDAGTKARQLCCAAAGVPCNTDLTATLPATAPAPASKVTSGAAMAADVSFLVSLAAVAAAAQY